MILIEDEGRDKLVNEILVAASQDEVKTCIDNALKSLHNNKANSNAITCFIDEMVGRLNEFNAMNQEVQQWSNIKMARLLFNHIKRSTQVEHA